ncbi:MAG: chemotaxis protein CheW [Gammaproteobacteria bacterium]|nr:MAG: chemotaxis protein CheW [Gammaproteobacteria bacterium]RKZ95581.1 MAG: chemotaxis protein CheW [Gammaproteobacteria bacterium]RKZ97970.1 MAG: chemotaxis protein CheW [Gammaproteobacteria bacterium]RLA01962.1 MAG: chemotaxis protein CheW [Gammaproteobacteria bacterium]HHA18185.1 chemotaxis protein CheW [Methylophaga sp.]
MADISTDFIPCVLIPLHQHYLLLPNTTIAEVIPMPRLSNVENMPDYWVGQHDWNSRQLPVIDLEALVENNSSDTDDANKLCILHGINTDANIKVYALPCYGVPQLIHLNEAALKLAPDTRESEFLHYQIQIGTKIAYIPNLDAIEASISQQQ